MNRWIVTVLLGILAALPTAAPAQDAPASAEFAKYPADAAYKGKVGTPDFKGRDREWNNLRTRIRREIAAGMNFAGKYRLIEVACGTNCTYVLYADLSTGKVGPFPLSGEKFFSLILQYREDSRLVVGFWVVDARCIREFVVWNGQSFARLGTTDIGTDDVCYQVDGRIGS